MTIALGCDHIVTDTKIAVSDHLKSLGHKVIDVGTYDFSRTHYPIYGKKIAECIYNGEAELGVSLCGTAVGITVAADKNEGIRAALVRDIASAEYARRELNANVIGVGGKIVGQNLLFDILETFLNTAYIPSTENKKVIEKINQIVKPLPNQTNNQDFFKEELDKWDQGFYHD